MSKSNRLQEFNSWLVSKPNITIVGDIPNKAWTKVTLTCSDHAFTWSTSPGNIRPDRIGCKHCASNKFIKPFWTKYNSLEHLRIIKGVPLKGSDSITFHCTKHEHVWDMTVQSFARWKHGCKLCAQEASISSSNGYTNWKSVRLGDTCVKVHGYEDHAIRYVLSKNIKANDLLVHGSHKVPTIRYNGNRNYFPDLFIPSMNRIVEVKSLYTLGFNLRATTEDSIFRGKRRFDNLLQKRLAVRQSGFKFKLLVFNNAGALIGLPKKWWTYSYSDLKQTFT